MVRFQCYILDIIINYQSFHISKEIIKIYPGVLDLSCLNSLLAEGLAYSQGELPFFIYLVFKY